MWPRTSWPLSNLTLNIVLGRASVISPSISIFSSLAMRRGAYLTRRGKPRSLGFLSAFVRVGDEPVAAVSDRPGAVAHLARVLRRLQLREHRAEPRALLDAEFAGEL